MTKEEEVGATEEDLVDVTACHRLKALLRHVRPHHILMALIITKYVFIVAYFAAYLVSFKLMIKANRELQAVKKLDQNSQNQSQEQRNCAAKKVKCNSKKAKKQMIKQVERNVDG